MAQIDTTVVNKLRHVIGTVPTLGLNKQGYRSFSALLHRVSALIPGENNKLKLSTEQSACAMGNAIDQRILDSTNKLFNAQPPFQLDDVLLSGSVCEGTQITRLKKNSSDFDFMLVLKNITVTLEDQKRGNLTVKENTPFVDLILTDDHLIEMWNDFVNVGEENTKLSSMKLKERLKENYDNTNGAGFMISLSTKYVENLGEGPAVTVTATFPGNGLGLPSYEAFHVEQLDFVLAINCDGWPRCAKEWLTRERRWPTEEMVGKIIEDGFHIVCKSSSEGDFRLSFSNAEAILVQNLGVLQHKTYLSFKLFVKHFKNGLNPSLRKAICSYYLKTIVLWYCEKHDADDWSEDSVVRHLLCLIDELILALRKHSLPMYFMPKYNLLEKLEKGEDLAERIEVLRSDLSLISNGILCESNNPGEMKQFVMNDFGMPQLLKKIINEGKCEIEDFVNCTHDVESDIDSFWENTTGQIPEQNAVGVELCKSIAQGPMAKFFAEVSKLMNEEIVKPAKEMLGDRKVSKVVIESDPTNSNLLKIIFYLEDS